MNAQRTLVPALALVLAIAAPATARMNPRPAPPRGTSATLNCLASTFAMRPVEVVRWDLSVDAPSPETIGAWAYVDRPLAMQTMMFDPRVADGALAVAHHDESVPMWQRAIGVLSIVHESYHLRHWGGAVSERRAECQGIRHFRVAAEMLGASRSEVDALYPYAAAAHFRLGQLNPKYADPACEVPWYWGSTGPTTSPQPALSRRRAERGRLHRRERRPLSQS
jgi:hypothetical protein